MDCPNCYNTIAKEVGHSGVAWGLEHQMASEEISEWGTVQIVKIDLGSEV